MFSFYIKGLKIQKKNVAKVLFTRIIKKVEYYSIKVSLIFKIKVFMELKLIRICVKQRFLHKRF